MLQTNIIEQLNSLNEGDDGELILYNSNVVWKIYVINGQPLYARDDLHPVRRWNRALGQHASSWNWREELFQVANRHLWECSLLDRGLNQDKLSLIRAKMVIRSVIQECLFDLSCGTDVEQIWKPGTQSLSESCNALALSPSELLMLAKRAIQLQQQWTTAGLQRLTPNHAPVLKQVEQAELLPINSKYLNGRFTLWDLAWRSHKSVVEVADELVPFAKQKIIRFHSVSDLPPPLTKQLATITRSLSEKQMVADPTVSSAPPASNELTDDKQPMIACIDDSPVLSHTLGKILKSAGYRTLSIQEPMRGFAQLIEHKPDLILLDLNLPNADGYSVCKFLRDTPVFQNTPIIILTAQNTLIDRAKAKAIGATEFLGKPPKAEELLQVVQRYIVS